MPEPTSADIPPYLVELLRSELRALMGSQVDAQALQAMESRLQWLELPGGQTLMRQGDPGDAMYILVSGRLRTYVATPDGGQRMVREVTRGQVVGEMSLYTGDPRSATLVAIRDSVLVRLGQQDFTQMLAGNAQLSISLTRQIIQRLRTEGEPKRSDRPVTLGLMAITDGVDLQAFAQSLVAPLQAALGAHEAAGGRGRVAVVDSARLAAELGTGEGEREGKGGGSPRPEGPATSDRRITMRLDEIEAAHDVVLLLADATPTAWTRRCTRQSDELLLLADADQPPRLHPIETECLMRRPASTDAAEVLVLLHPPDRVAPRGTAAWLARRPLADHVHLRRGVAADLARLARLQCRSATGLVLAGGGARGLAHLGVLRALREHGIDVDVVGGTSIGAVMAAYAASDRPIDFVLANARRAFSRSPTGDFNLMPLISLIKGRRLREVVSDAMRELMADDGPQGTSADASAPRGGEKARGGPAPSRDANIEDLWKGYFCIASNVTRAREEVLRHGPLLQAVLASVAIPGALPPVLRQGELLCDGGTLNNFPVDVMRNLRGVGRVIGVDLSQGERQPLMLQEMPEPWALLRDRLRPDAQRRYRVPSLVSYLISVTVLYSHSRQQQARALTDLYFNPPMPRVGMLDWMRMEQTIELGYRHACQVLQQNRPPFGQGATAPPPAPP